MRRAAGLLLLLCLGCYAVEGHGWRAVGFGATVKVGSPEGAFVGTTSPSEATAVLAGVAGIATAVAAFF